ncbi:MAG: hypothetical protein DWI22_01015 [Planctomycetota bacterium]|nr:MAG: hypothetical protein DWI22_01015 [Planctomycetota bacterium]
MRCRIFLSLALITKSRGVRSIVQSWQITNCDLCGWRFAGRIDHALNSSAPLQNPSNSLGDLLEFIDEPAACHPVFTGVIMPVDTEAVIVSRQQQYIVPALRQRSGLHERPRELNHQGLSDRQ